MNAIRAVLEWADLPLDTRAMKFAANLPRVNDATPHLKRQAGELRYPAEVEAAMAQWSDRAAA